VQRAMPTTPQQPQASPRRRPWRYEEGGQAECQLSGGEFGGGLADPPEIEIYAHGHFISPAETGRRRYRKWPYGGSANGCCGRASVGACQGAWAWGDAKTGGSHGEKWAVAKSERGRRLGEGIWDRGTPTYTSKKVKTNFGMGASERARQQPERERWRVGNAARAGPALG
jgi:hypothetical protein